ncbi:MAG: S41 family peptidase [Phycisphaerae bacterium]
MRLSRRPMWLLTLVCLATVSAAADVTLSAAYDAILRGDYERGQTVLKQLRDSGAPAEQVCGVENWLAKHRELVGQRDQLRRETFEWNACNAQKILDEVAAIESKQAEADLDDEKRMQRVIQRTYVALSFTAQAASYAASPTEFVQTEWVKEVRRRALAAADHFVKEERWSKAMSFFMVLERVDQHDDVAREGREKATRYVRLEGTYRDADEIKRRMEGVTRETLDRAIDEVADKYFKEPSFREMAVGAIENLVALCHTTKLYDRSKIFDGIANPTTRAFFMKKLEEQLAKLQEGKKPEGTRDEFGASALKGVFKTVRDLNTNSVSLPEQLLVIEFAEGALGKLDQFTQMVWPADATEFDKMMMGNFCGVGIQLGIDEMTGRLKVVTPLENSPALEAGIQPDDLIVDVDGTTTKDWSTEKAIRNITGKEGTKVTLTIFRPAVAKKLDVLLTRRPINLTTVRGVNRLEGEQLQKWNYMIDQTAGIAYLKLTGFNPDSHDELEAALKQAKTQGMRGLILDLRYNPGGLLDVARDIVSTFLGTGEIVSTRGRKENSESLGVTHKPDFPELPLVVLINDGSASASEILSGALQDHARAVVLGERSFGKGSVQKVISLSRQLLFGNNDKPTSRLKLTTSLYYLPDGRSPHKLPHAEIWGVDPDYKIELTPKEISKVIERERQAYIIHNEVKHDTPADEEARKAELEALKGNSLDPDGDEVAASEKDKDGFDLLSEEDIKLLRSDPHKASDVDPQIETALLHLRVKLAGDLPWPTALARTTVKDDKP